MSRSVRRNGWHGALAVAVAGLLLGGTGGSVSALQAQFGSTPPPGPILGTGDFITTDNGRPIATWEEYEGGTLYIWKDQSQLYKAIAGPCTGSGTAVCYTWIWYVDNLADPYNQEFWTPVQRGCMVLAADPLAVGEADGFAKETDVWVAGDSWTAVLQPVDGEGTRDPAASGVAAAPSGWDPAGYDQCFGAPLTDSGTGGLALATCTADYTGTWNGQSDPRSDSVTLTGGPAPSVVVTSGPLYADEADFLATAGGTWTVTASSDHPYSVSQSSVIGAVRGDTLTVRAGITLPDQPSGTSFSLQLRWAAPGGGWSSLDTCSVTIP